MDFSEGSRKVPRNLDIDHNDRVSHGFGHNFVAIGPILKNVGVLKTSDSLLSRSYVDFSGRFQESSAKSGYRPTISFHGFGHNFVTIGPILKILDVSESSDRIFSSIVASKSPSEVD